VRVAYGSLNLTATDLSNHVECAHKTQLEVAVVQGRIEAPEWLDPSAQLIRERGLRHEKHFIDDVVAAGGVITDFGELIYSEALVETRAAMIRGDRAIFQAALSSGRWSGRPDLMRRIEVPSELGSFSYEPWDAKLTRNTKATSVLQLCLYAELIGEIQGAPPRTIYLVTPGEPFTVEQYLTEQYSAYFRRIRNLTIRAVDEAPRTYPSPVSHCDLCRWWKVCDAKRRNDDHLSLVAGMSVAATKVFHEHSLETLAKVGGLSGIDFRSNDVSTSVLERLRRQAVVQLRARASGRPEHELHESTSPQHGFHFLPEPSEHDLFLDLEGDTFIDGGGREYLFGIGGKATSGFRYEAIWALTQNDERLAFESVIDKIVEARRQHRSMHVFHFGAYEPAAMKRLMSRYATREAEVDRLLRDEVFVDLHRVVKRSLVASVESYSLKALESHIQFTRTTPLTQASRYLAGVSWAIENGETTLPEQLRSGVEGYNRDDCESTLVLRNWLENIRGQAIIDGAVFRRPAPREQKPGEDERSAAPTISSSLLDNLTRFHSREEKPSWWEYFHLKSASDDELFDHSRGVSQLKLVKRRPGARSPIDVFHYPPQELMVHEGDQAHHRNFGRVGTVVSHDASTSTLELQRNRELEGRTLDSLFFHTHIPTLEQQGALTRLADWVAANDIDSSGKFRAARDIVLRRAPRIHGDIPKASADVVERACALARSLDQGVLPIQGPPGSGKTFIGATIIRALVKAGFSVGVTANSHAVIRNLLDAALQQAAESKEHLDIVQKVEEKTHGGSAIFETTDNKEVLERLRLGSSRVAGGTSWLWSAERNEEAVDVMLIDEAGQMALANAVAVAQAAKSVILLGDPRQLDQPMRGTHPDGVGVSVLEHMFDGAVTVADDRGIFLSETRRMAPALARFISEVFYDRRLSSRAGLQNQRLLDCGPFNGAGTWFLAAKHEGNSNASRQEVEHVVRLVRRLTRGRWVDAAGATHQLSAQDILVVAPYNAQVGLLYEALKDTGARVGTVDRFQGQEAPVVIYSMTASSPELAPRGLEFLYSLNRFNVATSRAKCVSIVLASPTLLEPVCKAPGQMELVNALCRYVELSTSLEL
jgi:predicted RecB family nuclease